MGNSNSGLIGERVLLKGHKDLINSIDTSNDGFLILSTGDSTMRLWTISGKLEKTWTHKAGVDHGKFSKNGELIACSCEDGNIYVYSGKTKNIMNQLNVCFSGVCPTFEFSACGRFIISVDGEKIAIWLSTDPRGGDGPSTRVNMSPLYMFTAPSPTCLAVFDRTVVVGTSDGMLLPYVLQTTWDELWDLGMQLPPTPPSRMTHDADPQPKLMGDILPSVASCRPVRGHRGAVTCIKIRAQTETELSSAHSVPILLSGSEGGEVLAWELVQPAISPSANTAGTKITPALQSAPYFLAGGDSDDEDESCVGSNLAGGSTFASPSFTAAGGSGVPLLPRTVISSSSSAGLSHWTCLVPIYLPPNFPAGSDSQPAPLVQFQIEHPSRVTSLSFATATSPTLSTSTLNIIPDPSKACLKKHRELTDVASQSLASLSAWNDVSVSPLLRVAQSPASPTQPPGQQTPTQIASNSLASPTPPPTAGAPAESLLAQALSTGYANGTPFGVPTRLSARPDATAAVSGTSNFDAVVFSAACEDGAVRTFAFSLTPLSRLPGNYVSHSSQSMSKPPPTHVAVPLRGGSSLTAAQTLSPSTKEVSKRDLDVQIYPAYYVASMWLKGVQRVYQVGPRGKAASKSYHYHITRTFLQGKQGKTSSVFTDVAPGAYACACIGDGRVILCPTADGSIVVQVGGADAQNAQS